MIRRETWIRGFACVTFVGVGIAASYLLWSAFCAFTAGRFGFVDYGKYTNMLWNCGHAQPFRLLVDQNYLTAHLSFSLAPLGLMFHLWDHPFLPALLQWLVFLAGALCLFSAAQRQGVPPLLCGSVLLFFVAYPLSQAAILSEFHGVTLLMGLVPWLYYHLLFSKRFAWVPLTLILGLREDAGLGVIPLLLYVAGRDRWRMGYGLAALAASYSAFACTELYALINGTGLSQTRGGLNPGDLFRSLDYFPLWPRVRAAIWVLLPALPFLFSPGWRPLLVIPSVAVLTSLFSPYPLQHSLSHHYGAASMVFLAVAFVESAAQSRPDPAGAPGPVPGPVVWRALALLAIILGMHACFGFLPLGRQNTPYYNRPDSQGLSLLRVATRVPRQGVLLCARPNDVFCANRADILTWDTVDPNRHTVDIVFLHIRELASRHRGRLRELIEQGTHGVTFFDGTHAILQRGVISTRNEEILRAWDERTQKP
jgi:uncharacterized membrane protein